MITIKNKWAGYLVYSNGMKLSFTEQKPYTISHFVAFDTDYQIDELKSATLEFVQTDYKYDLVCNSIGPIKIDGHMFVLEEKSKTVHDKEIKIITSDQTGSNEPQDGLFALKA